MRQAVTQRGYSDPASVRDLPIRYGRDTLYYKQGPALYVAEEKRRQQQNGVGGLE
jgi:hypothetical protein